MRASDSIELVLRVNDVQQMLTGSVPNQAMLKILAAHGEPGDPLCHDCKLEYELMI